MSDPHLSMLALDGIRLGRLPGPGERRHLGACETCGGYLQAGAEAAPLPLPGWLSGVSLPAVSSARSARRRWLWLMAAAPAVAAAALWLVVPRPQPEGTREKGAPTLRLFVKRNDRVFVWDGKQSVRPDDRLRLEVRRASYRFVSVAALPRSAGPPQLLYEGPLDNRLPLLPISFRVDDRGTEEVLSVILGQTPVPQHLHALAGPPDGEARTWRQILMLEKRGGSP